MASRSKCQGSLLVSDLIAETWRPELRAPAPDLALVRLADAAAEGALDDVVAAFFSGDCYPDRALAFMVAATSAPRLRWLHTFSAGVDHPVFAELGARGVAVTTSSGASAAAIGQMVLLYLLAWSRRLPSWLDAQTSRRWQRSEGRSLEGRTVAVLGMGPIGQEIARLTTALGMHVIGVRRVPTGDEPCETWSLDRLPELLPTADVVVLALPLTPDTRHIFGRDVIATLKRGAYLVNIGRGELVDEPALVDALRAGNLGGAALDVFEHEPLPADSPLWGLPNVIVTPHCAGNTDATRQRGIELFVENLHRFHAGLTLQHAAPLAPPTDGVP